MKSEQWEIQEERNYQVIKANFLIREAKNELSVVEMKTFAYIISKIKPTDKAFEEYVFPVRDYCKACGIDFDNGKNYKNVIEALKGLRDKSFLVTQEDGSTAIVGWIANAVISPGSGKVKIFLDRIMQKYLVNLYDNYTQYALLYTLPMESGYSIRIYELLKSFMFKYKHIQKSFELDELKRTLNCQNYDRFPDFRRRVLEPATMEINKYTDLTISWEPIKEGRKVTVINFHVTALNQYEQLQRAANATEALDGQDNIYNHSEIFESILKNPDAWEELDSAYKEENL